MLRLVGLIVLVTLAQTLAGDFQLPHFLPDYYSPAFDMDKKPLLFVSNTTTNGVEQFLYTTADNFVGLSIENIKCDRPRCSAIFNNILGHLNNEMKDKKGEFLEITQREFHAKIYEDDIERTVFGYVLPASIQIWTYCTTPRENYQMDEKFRLIITLANKQRYNEALSAGNVSMGHWSSSIYKYASQLLREDRKNEGLSVLKHLLAISPFNYKAHLDFIENTNDMTAAKNSAQIVFRNAEDHELIDKAAKYLGMKPRTLDSIPLLDKNETGLQLILIPLWPCNAWFLEDAAATYQQITGIPVKIRRLDEQWSLGTPDRIYSQRMIQSMLVKINGGDIDFDGWNKKKYIEELIKATESEGALSKYYAKDLINKIGEEPGQYFVNSYLEWFSGTIEKYRSDDDRTMYVGITEIDIYSGDNNYIFSMHIARKKSQVSILSYNMMLAKTLGEEYESRQRLRERIAKELVPASLKSLGIARSIDPTCPYSYSSGVDRLDQKTLSLSDPVKTALSRMKGPIK
jgi:predicted Zn-dependent protease